MKGGITLGQHSFQEVMRQWMRLCSDVPGKSDRLNICSDQKSGYICPMRTSGLCNKPVSKQTNNDRQEGERIILSWAAEHPEPVYPTWREWLIKIGGAVKKLYAQQYHYEAAQPTQLIEVVEVLDEPIPADIAQKLGIEPKEE